MRPSISTHVLDTERGEPARGLRVELFRRDVLLSAQATDADGRITDLVRGPLEPGSYRLVFRLGGGFFSCVQVEFAVDDPGRHYHIPLLVAPYACTTYRGS
ncbi:MAG TPA: hydroxyisourate hydrolase [bacterium]|nr:hydroxyisourate hydrolase [bacterium]